MKTRKKKSQSVPNRSTAQPLEQGPIQIAFCDNSSPIPVRDVTCSNYQECLNIAACLNWMSFSCENCTGEVAPHLRWRSRIERRRDPVCQALMPAPVIEVTEGGRISNQGGPGSTCANSASHNGKPVEMQSFLDRRNALDAIIYPHRITNSAPAPSTTGGNSIENASNEE